MPPEIKEKRGNNMHSERVKITETTDIYILYSRNNEPLGEIEIVHFGYNKGTNYYSLSRKYSRKYIKNAFEKSVKIA